MAIHPTAIVDAKAEIDPSAEIGAYAIIEPGVQIGPQVRIYPHAYVAQGTTLETGVRVHPFAVVGHHPQDLSWKGTPSYTRIGARTVIREHASVHRGTLPESTTVVGSDVYMMAMSHVAHNCQVADRVIFTNCAMLAGHVQVGQGTVFGGHSRVHQFTRVGELVMVGSCPVRQDVPPFMMVGPRGVVGLNTVGLRRAGIDADQRTELRQLYRLLYRSGTPFSEAVRQVQARARGEAARKLAAFLAADSRHGILGYRRPGVVVGNSD